MVVENRCFRPPLALDLGGDESHQVVRWLRFLKYVIKRPILEREAVAISSPSLGWRMVAIDAIARNGQSGVARTSQISND